MQVLFFLVPGKISLFHWGDSRGCFRPFPTISNTRGYGVWTLEFTGSPVPSR